MPCRRFKFDGGLLEAKAAHDAADEAGMFAEAKESVQGLPIHETEIRAAGDHRGIGNRIDHRVVSGGGDLLHRPRVLGGGTDGLHDVIAFLPLLNEHGDQCRRMLHVAVHGDHRVAHRKVHAAGDGDLVAKVSGKCQRPHMGITLGQLVDQFIGPVLGAIIHVNDLILHRHVLHDLRHFVVEIHHISFFIVYRCYDGYHNMPPNDLHYSTSGDSYFLIFILIIGGGDYGVGKEI